MTNVNKEEEEQNKKKGFESTAKRKRSEALTGPGNGEGSKGACRFNFKSREASYSGKVAENGGGKG